MKNSADRTPIADTGFLTADLNTKSTTWAHKVYMMPVGSPLENKASLYFKRFFDLAFSSLFICVFLSWMIPLLALLIKLDSKGPVFFLQKRSKKNKKLFTCIKFRTMIENDEADTRAARVDDPRITKIGKFLRHHHLDELPQFLNVWWGDMSLIGPRPYMISDNMKFESLIQYYPLRYKVKPGITGLAQVLGFVGPITGVENMEERLQHDIYYIHHWTAALDIKIVFRTFLKMIEMRE